MAENRGQAIKVDRALLEQLRPLAEAAGVEIPGMIQYQAMVNLDGTISDLGQQLGALCSRQPIFRQADALVAVDNEGVLRPMTPDRFGSFVEKFVTTIRWTKERGEHAYTIPKDMASKVMVADTFLPQIRKLVSYFPVCLPVVRADGTTELLEPGYDEQTESWTEDGIEYDREMDLDGAREVFQEVLGEWPYADLLGKPKVIEGSRDASVVLGGALGVFCRAMFGPGNKRPMAVVSGNQPGTGKTTLCKIMLAPVYGLPAEMSLPPTEEKMERLLDSVALGMSPTLFLDDVGRMMRSNALNKFITASVHGGTRLYTQSEFAVPNVTQVFVTGNDLPIEANLKRRVMWCELFLPGEVQGRVYKNEITDSMLNTVGFRSKMLAAMWAVVREWGVCPTRPAGRKVLKSFEGYSRTVGSMMEFLGWRDPFDEPLGISGGDDESRDFKELLMLAADQVYTTPHEYTTKDLVEMARDKGLLGWLVGAPGDPDLMKRDLQKWGKHLQPWRGRIFQRTDGKFYEVGKRDGRGGSVYPFRLAEKIEDLL